MPSRANCLAHETEDRRVAPGEPYSRPGGDEWPSLGQVDDGRRELRSYDEAEAQLRVHAGRDRQSTGSRSTMMMP
jgi:hypothetical protein